MCKRVGFRTRGARWHEEKPGASRKRWLVRSPQKHLNKEYDEQRYLTVLSCLPCRDVQLLCLPKHTAKPATCFFNLCVSNLGEIKESASYVWLGAQKNEEISCRWCGEVNVFGIFFKNVNSLGNLKNLKNSIEFSTEWVELLESTLVKLLVFWGLQLTFVLVWKTE